MKEEEFEKLLNKILSQKERQINLEEFLNKDTDEVLEKFGYKNKEEILEILKKWVKGKGEGIYPPSFFIY